MSDLNRLSEEMATVENISSPNEPNIEEDETANVLRQRHITTNPQDDSYDLLERDVAYLQERLNEVASLIAEQEKKLSRIEYYKTIAHNRMHTASSFVHNVIHNRYVTTASGALIGASIGGPIGFVMGAKIGALVAVSGSALGALSMTVMRQRLTETDESQNENLAAYNQAML